MKRKESRADLCVSFSAPPCEGSVELTCADTRLTSGLPLAPPSGVTPPSGVAKTSTVWSNFELCVSRLTASLTQRPSERQTASVTWFPLGRAARSKQGRSSVPSGPVHPGPSRTEFTSLARNKKMFPLHLDDCRCRYTMTTTHV